MCVYSRRINDRDCVCVIGASLPPETLRRLIGRDANDEPIKRLLYYRRAPRHARGRGGDANDTRENLFGEMAMTT